MRLLACDREHNRTRFSQKVSIDMGRGKVELKRIEDKSSRQVSFSKRRNGLMKKSHELAVLCEVDVALFIFSVKGRLYEFSTDDSMTRILSSYQSYKETEELTRININEKLASECNDVSSADELTEIVQRHLDEINLKKLEITGLNYLERDLQNFLRILRIRKTQLMMGVVKDLQKQEMQLKKEKRIMMNEIMAARTNNDGDGSGSGDGDATLIDFQIT